MNNLLNEWMNDRMFTLSSRSICLCVCLCGLIAVIDVDDHPDLSLIYDVVHSSQVGV